MTLGKMFEETAQRFPRKCAIKFQKQKISYREMRGMVNRTAHGFLALGLQKGDRVGILAENCPEYIITYFAVLEFGGIAVPINNFLTGNEVKYIIDNCEVKVLVTAKKFLRALQPVLPRIESLRHVIIINDPEQKAYMSFAQLQESRSSEPVQADISPKDLAVFIYTSGTTGHPKGAMLSHSNLVSNTKSSAEVFRVVPKDKFLLFLPMFHSFTFTTCVLLPVIAGATII